MSHEPMELRTYTGLWNVERRLYKLYDYTLPMPVSVRQIGIIFGAGIPWIILLKVLHVPFHAPFHVIWIAPPAVLAWYANRPIAEGKRLGDLVLSHIRYWFQPRRYARLGRTSTKPVTVAARVQIWRPLDAPEGPQSPTEGVVTHDLARPVVGPPVTAVRYHGP